MNRSPSTAQRTSAASGQSGQSGRSDSVDQAGPASQGGGDHTAAPRQRESVEESVDAGKVDAAARQAAPDDAQQARALQEAEEAGRARATQ